MKCPVCGQDCVRHAHELIEMIPAIFAPCPGCTGRTLNKRKPLPDRTYALPCSCGKRFIDEVFAHMYVIMLEEQLLTESDPLSFVGSPLVHPGFAMETPPWLPVDSLVLLSNRITKPVAERLVAEVPELRGVVRSDSFVPGLHDIDADGIPDTYELLAGCDVRANIFYTQNEPIVTYKQQSVMHIEFPRGYDPKIVSVGVQVRQHNPKVFVDACCGAGTLGIVAGLYDVPHIIMNDAWYAAAFWSAYNLGVNSENLSFDDIRILFEYEDLMQEPVVKEPKKIAETVGGDHYFEVWQSDYRLLHQVLPENVDLSVIDLFDKMVPEKVSSEMEAWKQLVGGEVFIP